MNDQIREVLIRNVRILHYVFNNALKHFADNLEKIEPDTLDWIENFEKNSVFYDIGASTGPYSTYAAIKVGAKVVAFEPEAQNFAVLEMNHYLNRDRIVDPIISINCALSDKIELGRLFITKIEAGQAMKILDNPISRMEKKEFKPAHIQFVLKQTLDDIISRYNLPHPNYIKIDVDGSERKLIQGSKKTFSNKKLKSILIELLDPNGESSKIVELICGLGFKMKSKKQVEHYEGLYNCIFTR